MITTASLTTTHTPTSSDRHHQLHLSEWRRRREAARRAGRDRQAFRVPRLSLRIAR
jgi:hypothetical protein